MAAAVVENDGDLVGVGDHVIVGDHDAGGIDDEAGAQRVDAARAALPGRLLFAALRAAAVEEVAEQFVELRIVRKLRLRLLGAAAPGDVLRGRDVDDRLDHLFGDVGDPVGPALRERRRCERWQHDGDGGGSERRLPDRPGKPGESAEHGGVKLLGESDGTTVLLSRKARKGRPDGGN